MKVLHVELGKAIVGGPQQVIYLLEGLQARGIDNVLVAAAGRPLAARLGGTVAVRETSWGGDTDLGFFFRILGLIRSERPDVVHLHAGPGAALAALAAKLMGVPCVLSRRVDSRPRGRFSRRSYEALYARVICISQAIYDVMARRGVRRDRLVLIRSSVKAADWDRSASREELRAEFGLPAEALVLGVAAQLVARKGHRVLFKAMSGLDTNVRLIIFGDGELRGQLEAEVAAAGLGGVVTFAGHRNDLPRWMGCLDLVVHPALMEGLGVALLQAASAGVPVVASAVGGIPEAVADGVSGVLVPPRDVAALRSAIVGLLGDKERRLAMGQAARARVLAEFDVATMVERHIALYREVTAR